MHESGHLDDSQPIGVYNLKRKHRLVFKRKSKRGDKTVPVFIYWFSVEDKKEKDTEGLQPRLKLSFSTVKLLLTQLLDKNGMLQNTHNFSSNALLFVATEVIGIFRISGRHQIVERIYQGLGHEGEL